MHYSGYTIGTESSGLRPLAWAIRARGEGGVMSCPACGVGNQMEFSAEMLVHRGGLKNLDNSGVMLFPKLLVCVDCGFSQFTVPKAELASLTTVQPGQRLAATAGR
jgi:hypothetical protein